MTENEKGAHVDREAVAGAEPAETGASVDGTRGAEPGSAALKQELADLNAKWLRALADLDNYRKRTERDRCRWSEQAREGILLDLVGIMDDLERALASCDGAPDAGVALRDGVELIRRRLAQVLEKNGVLPIDTEGAEFDPALHEAVCQVESDEHDSNRIVSETQRGYRLGDRLLRCSKVVVAR
jgi:molecular chaperone GrpE